MERDHETSGRKMTNDQYHELVEFLGRQFAAVGDRFTGVEGRLTGVEERLTRVEERLTRVEVFAEENRHLIQAVAEGVTNVDRKVDTLREEMIERFAEQRELMERTYRHLDERVTRLESGRGRPL